MLRTVLLAVTLFASNSFIVAQETDILEYYLVWEYVYSEEAKDYVLVEGRESFGEISINEEDIIISGDMSRNFEVFSVEKAEPDAEEINNRDMYHCVENLRRFGVAITPDKLILTIIGVDYKYIYMLKPQ